MKNIIEGILETRQVFIDDKELKPGKSQKAWNHSPDGFMWGYHGSGPAQLALAILLEFTERETAIRLHQKYKREIIAALDINDDFILDIDIKNWIDQNKKKGDMCATMK